MTAATDSRAFNGLGTGLNRSDVQVAWTGPIADNVNLPSGTLAGALLSDTNSSPVIYAFLGDGTMRALGFVKSGFDNTQAGHVAAARPVHVDAETGKLVDAHAGGGSAILQVDIYKAALGLDNQTCSKLAADGPCIGMLLGLDADGSPVVLVDPYVAALLLAGNPFDSLTGIKTSTYSANFGEIVRCDPTGGGFAVNLPAIATWTKSRPYRVAVKNVTTSANAITVTPSAGQTIDGGATFAMNQAREYAEFVPNGATDWLVS